MIIDQATISANRVHAILRQHILADGLGLVLDMERSQAHYLFDKKSQRLFVDMFTFFASNPLGMNHPKMRHDEAFKARLMDAALNKVSNSDVYTEHMARFVDTFSRVGIPAELPHAFFISGGALAVENTLKAAFDWKVRKNFQKGYRYEKGHQVLHFEQAFHGRSGYTLSLTNTDPNKVALFPKFNWPRVTSPNANRPHTPENLEQIIAHEERAIAQMKTHFLENKDDIACIILETIQGEGGDNHFRPEFFQTLRTLADENEALLIFDEVQTGVGLTGNFWAYQGFGAQPDMIAFGKKTQVCGMLASRRLEEVDDHVFEKSSRINSTWGGNLVDMVRFDRILEIIEEDHLVENAATVGAHLLQRLQELANQYPEISNPRGKGLMCAFDLHTVSLRNEVRKTCYDKGLIILGCGEKSLRFRPNLCVTTGAIDEGIDILEDALKTVMGR